MKAFVGGAVLGASLAAAALVGYAYGQSRVAPQGQEGTGLAGSCRVSVGFGQLTPGTQCNFNTVQVGIQSGYLLCADVAVDCSP